MDTYTIEVLINAGGNIAQVLTALAGQFTGIHTRVNQLNNHLREMGLLIGGIGATMAGAGILRGMVSLVEHTKDLSHELVQIQKLGLDAQQFSAVQQAAKDVSSRIPGVTQKDALEAYGVSYSIFGHDNALKLMEPLEKFSQVIGNTTGKFDTSMGDLMKIVRSADLIGAFTDHVTHQVDTSKLQQYLGDTSKIMLATHGMVSPQVLLGLAQQGGPALSHVNQEGFIHAALMAQMMGGPRAGTSLMSLFSQFSGGKMTLPTAQHLEEIGLLQKGDYAKAGVGVKVNDEVLKRWNSVISNDPLKLVTDLLEPAMKSKGLSEEDQTRKIWEIMGRQTTQRLVFDMMRNMGQIQGETGRIMGAMDIDPSKDLANAKDLEQAVHNLDTAWKNFMYSLGGPEGQGVALGLNKLTAGLQGLADFFNAHPKLADAAFTGAISVGLGLIGGGVVAIGAAVLGFIGIPLAGFTAVGAALVAITTAVGAFVAFHWDDIGPAVKKFADGFKAWNTAIMQELGDSVKWFIGVVPTSFASLGTALINSLDTAIQSFIAAIPGIIGSIGSALMNALKSIVGGAATSIPKGMNPADTAAPGDVSHMKMNYTPGAGSAAPHLINASFVPANNNTQTVQVHTAINLDGRKIGDAVTEHLASMSTSRIAGSRYSDPTYHSPPSDVKFA